VSSVTCPSPLTARRGGVPTLDEALHRAVETSPDLVRRAASDRGADRVSDRDAEQCASEAIGS